MTSIRRQTTARIRRKFVYKKLVCRILVHTSNQIKQLLLGVTFLHEQSDQMRFELPSVECLDVVRLNRNSTRGIDRHGGNRLIPRFLVNQHPVFVDHHFAQRWHNIRRDMVVRYDRRFTKLGSDLSKPFRLSGLLDLIERRCKTANLMKISRSSCRCKPAKQDGRLDSRRNTEKRFRRAHRNRL